MTPQRLPSEALTREEEARQWAEETMKVMLADYGGKPAKSFRHAFRRQAMPILVNRVFALLASRPAPSTVGADERWISVEDRKPTVQEFPCIMTDTYGNVWYQNRTMLPSDWSLESSKRLTHWMPMPVSPTARLNEGRKGGKA